MVFLLVQFSYWLTGATMFGLEILEEVHIQEGTQRLTLRNCHFGTFRKYFLHNSTHYQTFNQ